MKDDQTLEQQLYNLILDPATRDWERQLLVKAKTANSALSLQYRLDQLMADLRPLATRDSLTPDVMDFYLELTGTTPKQTTDLVILHDTPDPPFQERAVFAGGCFWCMVEPFDQRPGITAVISGYTGGQLAQPTYEQVSSQTTGHVEAVEILYDRRQVTYPELVDLYWQLIDPTDDHGQVVDRGTQYRPIIFVNGAEQRRIAEASKQGMIEAGHYRNPIEVTVEPLMTYWPAENYHQNFYQKQPQRYRRMERSRQRFLWFQRHLQWLGKRH